MAGDDAGIVVPPQDAALLADALGGAGFVNYPTEWWHWSFGDRYWAYLTGRHAARYGAVAGLP